MDDGAINLQTRLDISKAKGYPAYVDGVAIDSIPWNDQIHEAILQSVTSAEFVEIESVDGSNSSSPPSLLSVD